MKKSICTIGFILLGSLVFASTTQQGIVKTKGRLNEDQTITKGTPLSDAFVTVQGAQTVTSNKKGLFSVALTSKDYYLKDVNKEGYVLCDADMLSRPYAYSPNPLYIVMETPAQQMEDKIFAERKLRRTLQRQLQQREDEIDSLKTRQQISEEEYRQQLQQIYSDQKENERLIAEMAERYASIDYDQLDEFNRQISALILEGKLTEADSLIRTKGDIASRIESLKEHQEKNQQEEQALKKRMKALEKSKAYTQKELEDLAQDCYSLFEIFKMQHKNDSAAYYLELRASLDTTNVEWLFQTGNFIEKYINDYSRALAIYTKALCQAQKQKDSSREEIVSYIHLADLFNQKAEFSEAQKYYLQALSQAELTGITDCDILSNIYHNLGILFFKKEQMDKADSVISLSFNYINCTSNPPQKMSSYHRIKGKISLRLSNYDQAILHYKQALKLQIDNGMELSGETANIYGNIGGIYEQRDIYDSALFYFEKSLEIDSIIYGTFHSAVSTDYNNIGSIYNSWGKYDIALMYYNKALSIGKKIFGEQHPKIATTYNNIGHNFLGMQTQIGTDSALYYFNEAIRIDTCIYGLIHSDVATLYTNLGYIYSRRLNDYANALECYNKTLKIYQKLYNSDHPRIAICYNNIGSVYKSMNEFNLALEYFDKALEIMQHRFGNRHTQVAAIYNNIGSVYSNTNEYSKALEAYTLALNINKEIYNDMHVSLVENYNNIAVVYMKKKDYSTAITNFFIAVDIAIQNLGENNIKLIAIYDNIGLCYEENNQVGEAMMYYQKELSICKKMLAPNHPRTLKIEQLIESLQTK